MVNGGKIVLIERGVDEVIAVETCEVAVVVLHILVVDVIVKSRMSDLMIFVESTLFRDSVTPIPSVVAIVETFTFWLWAEAVLASEQAMTNAPKPKEGLERSIFERNKPNKEDKE